MIRHRFSFLLVTLLVLLLTIPLMRDVRAARILFTILFYGTLVSAVLAVAERRKHFIVAGTLAVIVVVLRGVSLAIEDPSWWLNVKIVGLIAEMLCFGYTIVLIVKHVLRADRVTFDMICASLCAYLLIGIMWAQLYILLTATAMSAEPRYEVFIPSLIDEAAGADLPPGVIGPDAPGGVGEPGSIDHLYLNAIYLSFVTLSTLGYGDIRPVDDLARMCTVVEAIIGQFYLAVLVARLVGLYIAGARKDGVPP